MTQATDRKIRAIEVFCIRRELDSGTGVALTNRIDNLQLRSLVSIRKCHAMEFTVALYRYFKQRGKCVHDGNANAVQATGEVVVTLRKLTAGVESGQDQFDARQPFLFMEIDWHTAAIVFNTQRTIGVKHHVNTAGVSGEGFIHTVIDHFLGQVVRTTGVGVHSRALTHRVQAAQYFNGIGVVLLLAHKLEVTPQEEKFVNIA